MNYEDARLQKILAAEYVLGTLRGRARQRFERLLWTRSGLRAEVRYWEAQLAPLLASVKPVRPRDRVWTELELRIAGATVATLPPTTPAANASRWLKTWAVAASLAVVALSVQLYRQTQAPAPVIEPAAKRPAMVAMLTEPKSAATWLVAMSPDEQQIRVVASGSYRLDAARQSLELWIIGDDGTPRSLGLMPAEGRASMPMPEGLQLPAKAVLALSLEPAGGSPTGLPTGPVLTTSPVVAL